MNNNYTALLIELYDYSQIDTNLPFVCSLDLKLLWKCLCLIFGFALDANVMIICQPTSFNDLEGKMGKLIGSFQKIDDNIMEWNEILSIVIH